LKLSLLGRIRFEISKFHVSIQFLGVYGIYTVEPILYKNGTSGTTPNSLRNGSFLRWTDARLIAGTRKSTPVNQRSATGSPHASPSAASLSRPTADRDSTQLLDGFGLHVSPAHFGSHGIGQVAPNLGISIETQSGQSEYRPKSKPSSHLVGCFLVSGFDAPNW
jgi:hypothetical protein